MNFLYWARWSAAYRFICSTVWPSAASDKAGESVVFRYGTTAYGVAMENALRYGPARIL